MLTSAASATWDRRVADKGLYECGRRHTPAGHSRSEHPLRGARFWAVLALIAAPMGSSGFAALAELMAQHYTVVTYDPRGSEHTTVADRTETTTPELLAEDVHRVLKQHL